MSKIAIITGSIAGGFDIEHIATDSAAAEEIVIKHLSEGHLAEAIEISLPRSRSKHAKDYQSGEEFIVFGSIGNGISIYGPFPDPESANDFAENTRGEDEEWEMFTFSGAPVEDDSPTINPKG